jgi:hypothetical protein
MYWVGQKKGALAFSSPNHEFLPVYAQIFRQWSLTSFVNQVQISE